MRLGNACDGIDRKCRIGYHPLLITKCEIEGGEEGREEGGERGRKVDG